MVKATKSAVEKPTTPAKVDAAPKAPRAKKVAEPKEVVAAPVEVASTQSVPETVAADTAVAALPVKMTEFSAKLQQLVGVLSALKNDFKTLEKSVTREMKAAQKASSKKRRNNANRKPSGFIKPTRISNELAAFLGKTVGTEMARTDVSKEINAYIQSNGLQDKKNGRKINPDAKLTELLKLGKDDELTYFNLQRFMKHHFIKPEVVATA
uniref:DM2 domain-containing protein n=1 Tax=viral metagenome TaxID=1070528 RepID=A0A6C0JNW0_9ZZZZ